MVVLYDESRGIWVEITNDKIYFNKNGNDPNAAYWRLIAENPTGHWVSDAEFVTKTGSFKQDNGGIVWIERQRVGEANTFVRVTPKSRLVVLHDESRGIWIKLTDGQASFNAQGSDPNANDWHLIAENPTGYWISNTKFITKTGYFRQEDGGNSWIEQQADDSHHLVRVL